MHLLYLDESGNTGTDYDNKQQPIFVLGGLIVDEKDWHYIDEDFKNKITKISPLFSEHEIHTNELFNSSKKSVFYNTDWKENIKVLEKLVKAIVSYDIKFIFNAIDKKEFKSEITELWGNAFKIDPYLHSYQLMLSSLRYSYENKENKIILFMDKIINISEELKDHFYPANYKTNVFIEKENFIDSKYSTFIQMVDVFSFYINKYYCIESGYNKKSNDKTKHCIDMYNILKPKIINKDSHFMKDTFYWG